MTLQELKDLKAEYPTALSVWYDNMHEMSTGMLIEALIVQMPTQVLSTSLVALDKVIKQIREEEKHNGAGKKTE